MSTRKLAVAVVMCVVLCILAGLFVEHVYAQKSTSSGDKGIASKRGLEVLGGTKKKDVPTASKLQKAIGIGSVFVMIAVLKWL